MGARATDRMLLGRYRLVRRLGRGGMGAVWEAEDVVLRRPVAVKLLYESLAGDGRLLERFRREARAAGSLRHPNVAEVFDYGEDDGGAFIVMELIDGRTLADVLREHGPLDPPEAVRIAREAAAAVQAAHDAGIVHRDVKPENIMLTRTGEVRVMDFGVAAAAWDTPLTATGSTVGTATYLAPERAMGKRASPASDVYSLGVVIYEMLAGTPPFQCETPVATATAHVHDPPPPLRERAPGVHPALAAAVEAALAKDPGARPSSAAAFAQSLRDSTAEGQERTATLPTVEGPERTATLPTVRAGGPAGHRRAARWFVLGVLMVAALAGVLAAVLATGGRPSPAPTSHPRATGGSPAAAVPRMPNLVGMGLLDAENALSPDHVRLTVRPAEGPPAVVQRTDPGAGAALRPGANVTLFVGVGQQPEDHGDDHGRGKGKNGGG